MTVTLDHRPETTTIAVERPRPEPIDGGCASGAPRLDIVELSQHVKGRQTLHDVSFSVRPGEIVAIAGGSGAGKTTLLEAMVGVRPAESGWVLVDNEEFDPHDPAVGFGYVPQDDIIHQELPLRRTLEHAARLRMPDADTPMIDAAVTRTLERLDLLDRADVVVGSLSGGQRKRASIGAELLTDPHLFFLDEPTSGLDPATGAGVMRQLRRLADSGTTIVVTTHAPSDLSSADRLVFLARDGHLAFVGTPAEARDHFDVDDLADVYERLANDEPVTWSRRFEAVRSFDDDDAPRVSWPRRQCPSRTPRRVGTFRQWRALTRRNVDLLIRNKLTLAILIGSPVMVIGMKAVLFRSGTFAADQPSAVPAIQTMFWIAFSSFFFGVTYGLLQIVGEFAIFRRERFAGLSAGAYVASKLAVLAPVVAGVNIAMLAILRGLDRLPGNSMADWVSLTVTLTLVSMAALSMGLLASAAVQNAAQATLALPMLCFPQVLFAGAVVPVSEMAGFGRVLSAGLAGRWGFESMGRTLEVRELVGDDAGTQGYLDAFTGSAAAGWVVLVTITGIALAATVVTLQRRSGSPRR